MGRRPKSAVRVGHGIMCNVCGINCGKGGALAKHVKGAHGVEYADYKRCFYGEPETVLGDSWDDTVKTSSGKAVVTHILVRRFICNPGPRGATRAARRLP